MRYVIFLCHVGETVYDAEWPWEQDVVWLWPGPEWPLGSVWAHRKSDICHSESRCANTGATTRTKSYNDGMRRPESTRRSTRSTKNDVWLRQWEQKSYMWSSDMRALKCVCAEVGLPFRSTLEALGAEWQVTSSGKPENSKEAQRIQEAERRLMRTRHLSVGVVAKVDIKPTTCLSLLGYVNPPRMTSVKCPLLLCKEGLVG